MKVTILTPLQNGNNRHDSGDVVDLPKTSAQQLIDCGAAVVFDAEAVKLTEAEAKLSADKPA